MHPHPESPMSNRPFAPHQGQLFMDRLGGRSTAAAPVRLESQAVQAADSELQDLDQRVRNVGEW